MIFSMVSEKLCRGKYWTNRYLIQAAELSDAVTIGGQIRAIERNTSYDFVALTKYRVSDMAEDTDVYSTITDNLVGARTTPSGGDDLPLFCRVRMDFNVAGGGRPSRKYFCPPILEGETTAEQLTAAALSFYLSTYIVPLITLGSLVDPDNQAWVNGSVAKDIGMRQLRRGSKRRALPVLP